MASTRQSAKKGGNEGGGDGQLVVEEKIVKVNGEMTIRKYAKGRFLGKVETGNDTDGRAGLPNAMNFRTWRRRR